MFNFNKKPREKYQVRFLEQQLFPSNIKRLIEAYNDATKWSFSDNKIDCTPKTPDQYRLQARLTPKENNGVWSPVVYLRK